VSLNEVKVATKIEYHTQPQLRLIIGKVKMPFNEERAAFSINGTGIDGYPCAKMDLYLNIIFKRITQNWPYM
jgi:hypothetical protein